MFSESEYFQEGTILKHRYQIIKFLGEGSFGQTYLAEDTYKTNSQGTVVIKKLKPHSDSQIEEVAKKKFIAEAFSLRKLGYKHSQIPTLFDFFYKDDDFFLVQEYVDGIDLATRLNLNSDSIPRVVFNEAEAINLLIQLLNILCCIHENQTIHLDIKPLNIIWRKKDNKYFLIDFGCVKDISNYILITDRVHSSTILGTPHYMPQEQSMGNPRYNSDIYALGIVVIQAITGLNCIDFKYDDNGQLIWQKPENITNEFQKILQKMICFDYHEPHRYQTAIKILEDLKALQKSNSIQAIIKLFPGKKKIFIYQYLKLLFLFLGFSSLLWYIWEIWLKPRIWEVSNKVSIGEQVYYYTGKKCANYFKNQQYLASKKCFRQAMIEHKNNPELAIYYNNSLAFEQNKKPFYLAVVVPVFNNNKVAQEILRGIAHSQHIFNQNGGINRKLLVIAIADDGNQPDNAQNIAKLLREEKLISGVIGHNSSTATSAGIREYNKSKIPVISATSTSSNLQQEDINNQFFRTAISDEVATKVLAEYITKVARAKKIAVFHEPNKNHPESAKLSLIENLTSVKVVTLEDLNLKNQKFFHLDTIRDIQEAKRKIKYLLANDVQHIALFPDISNLNSIRLISLAISEIPEARNLKIYGVTAMYNYDTIYDSTSGNLVGLKGAILSLDWAREIPQATLFLERFKDYWGSKNSLISWRTATSYDATQVFIQAFKDGKRTRKNILNYLQKDFSLDAGYTSGLDVTFDPEGNRVGKPILVELVLDGKQLKFQLKCDFVFDEAQSDRFEPRRLPKDKCY